MNAHLHSADYSDEDFIDMEMGSDTNIIISQEFEFQMFSTSLQSIDTTTSPADELFYKGKLLPLHLPPRLQMVDKLLQNPTTFDRKICRKTNTFCEDSFTTPFESCNITPPSQSCPVSRELNPDEYMYEYFAIASCPADGDRYNAEGKWMSTHPGDENPRKSWIRKLKMIKQCSIGSKLKASRAYIKSWFNKPCSSDKSTASALKTVDNESFTKRDECENKSAIVSTNTPFSQIQKGGYKKSPSVKKSFKKEDNGDSDEKGRSHRGSFSAVSGAIKRISSSKYSSSVSSSSGASSTSSSNGSNGFQEIQLFTKSISTNLEVENPIQAAIAHCKKSQQQIRPRKTVSDLGICSFSASTITT